MKLRQLSHRPRVWLALTAAIVLTSAGMIPIGIAIPGGEHPRVASSTGKKCPRAKPAPAAKPSPYTEKASSRLLQWLL